MLQYKEKVWLYIYGTMMITIDHVNKHSRVNHQLLKNKSLSKLLLDRTRCF